MTQYSAKVTAYITCDGHLLVFDHVDFPEAGVQVPSGTVDGSEDREEAVLREAREETGLIDLRLESYLGSKEYSFQESENEERFIRRHYFHLTLPGPISQRRWRHWEMAPSEGPESQILFELYWIKISDGIPELAGALGDMLHRL